MATIAIAACSGNSGQGHSATGTSAQKICGGTLDKPAAGSLRRLSGTSDFKEDAGVSDSGSEYGNFSASWAADRLHRDNSSRIECNIYKAGEKDGELFIGLRFSASNAHPTKKYRLANGALDVTVYPVGAFAETEGSKIAILYFVCPTKGPDGADRFISASIVTGSIGYKSNTVGRDFMEMLNSASRHLAIEMGCADTAKLPIKMPEAEGGE